MEFTEKIKLLKELGLNAISEKLLRKKTGKEKLLKATNDYRYATKLDLDDFNKEMRKFNKELVVVAMKDFDRLPPDDVLVELKKARDKKCFDTFHIAYIRAVKDPILFGKIEDFNEIYFYIAQWGDDVNIEDIIGTE
uniref:Uncharacterized protein n=1 Tax=viral metagenome TaxID=1070528 RepID=A0A6M3JDS1_9ZZZZ